MPDPVAPTRPAPPRVRVRSRAATTDSRGRRRRMFTWILVAGALILLVNALVGENGYLATLRLRHNEVALQHTLADLRYENQRLHAERLRLESDPDTIERTIREELGYIKPGEITVVVHDVPTGGAPSPAR